MPDLTLFTALLDSLKDPVLFVDTNHTIRYMNKAAIAKHKQGAALIGRSLLDCHKEASQRVLLDHFAALQAGDEERLTGDGPKQRTFMRAVRDAEGRLVGYYERYETPTAKTQA